MEGLYKTPGDGEFWKIHLQPKQLLGPTRHGGGGGTIPALCELRRVVATPNSTSVEG